MVKYTDIQESNALINDANAPRVSVFVGGTSGIGKFTIKALVTTGASLRIYLIGRKTSEERTRAFIQELHAINSQAEIVWIEGEVSLLTETKRICEQIKGKERRIDLLFLTAGYAPFGHREETKEGLEITQSLEYYSRILFILHLLPVLHEAEAARVVSVLGGGLERGIPDLDDLELKQPGNFGLMKARFQTVAMNTAALDKLASDNPGITFIHSWPGSVNTGNVRRGDPGVFMAWLIWLVFEPLIWLLSSSDDESGQRHLFQCTSAAFGGHGSLWKGESGLNSREQRTVGLFLVNYKCDCTPNAKVLAVLREKAQERVWDHTQAVVQPHL